MRKALLLLTLLLAACIIKPPEVDITPKGPFFELTEVDVLPLIDNDSITGDQVTIKGVKIGDSLPQVVSKLGAPQYIDEYPSENIVNIKYENDAGDATLNFHLKDDQVQRMTVKAPFNPNLVGKTQMQNWHQHNITTAFGKPDHTYDSSFFRVYEYHELGLEILHKRKKMLGFAFVPKKI